MRQEYLAYVPDGQTDQDELSEYFGHLHDQIKKSLASGLFYRIADLEELPNLMQEYERDVLAWPDARDHLAGYRHLLESKVTAKTASKNIHY